MTSPCTPLPPECRHDDNRARRHRHDGLSRRLLVTLVLVLGTPIGGYAAGPQRIVSLIPAVTEMIFAMGDGGKLVGVTSFDRHPPEVSRIARVGALLDPDVERILGLKPDLVVLYNTQTGLKQRLDRAGIPYYSYEHRALPDILTTIRAVGTRIGSGQRGEQLASDLERGIALVRSSVSLFPRPRTLLVFERDPSSLRQIYASGGYGFMHDMLEAAGGADVFADIKKQSVQAGTELILARRPDVIIELRYGDGVRTSTIPREMQAWNALGSVPAVRNGRVYALVGDEFVTPGPRVVEAIQRLAQTLHPEVR
jgi:iron complex transport system substrate-binding protein